MKTSNQQKTHIKTPRVFCHGRCIPPWVFQETPGFPRTSGVTSAATAAASPSARESHRWILPENETLDAERFGMTGAFWTPQNIPSQSTFWENSSAAFLKKAAFRDAWRKFWFYHTQQLPVGLAQKVWQKKRMAPHFPVSLQARS